MSMHRDSGHIVSVGGVTLDVPSQRRSIETITQTNAPASAVDSAHERRAAEIVRQLHARSEGAAIVEGMLDAIDDHTRAQAPPASWPGVHSRAVEHVVTAPGTTAATPHGTFDVTTSWIVDLAAAWTQVAMPITAATSIVEIDAVRGIPALPSVATAPTAGKQNGEKLAAYSKAFKVDRAATVDDRLDAVPELVDSAGVERGR